LFSLALFSIILITIKIISKTFKTISTPIGKLCGA